MLLAGSLSKFDLQREYKTDASDKFKPYIVDPEATKSKTDRYLTHRYSTTSTGIIPIGNPVNTMIRTQFNWKGRRIILVDN